MEWTENSGISSSCQGKVPILHKPPGLRNADISVGPNDLARSWYDNSSRPFKFRSFSAKERPLIALSAMQSTHPVPAGTRRGCRCSGPGGLRGASVPPRAPPSPSRAGTGVQANNPIGPAALALIPAAAREDSWRTVSRVPGAAGGREVAPRGRGRGALHAIGCRVLRTLVGAWRQNDRRARPPRAPRPSGPAQAGRPAFGRERAGSAGRPSRG
jgi:hypothetical protein